MGTFKPGSSLRDFVRQGREERFRRDFAVKYGRSVEDVYPGVPFAMVHDLHRGEFHDPFDFRLR